MSRLIVMLALALVVGACGSDEVGGDAPSPAGADDADPEPAGPVAVGEAVALPDGAMLVSGQLLVAPGAEGVLLCAGLTRSIPPLCAGSRMTVEDLDLETVELNESGDVRWTGGRVTLAGEKLGSTLFGVSAAG